MKRFNHFLEPTDKFTHLMGAKSSRNIISAFGVSNIICWFDASYGLDQNTGGGVITSWIDKVNGMQLIGIGTTKPKLITSEVNFNNYPCCHLSTSTGQSYFDCQTGQTMPISRHSGTVALVIDYLADSTVLGSYLKNQLIGDDQASNARTLGYCLAMGTRSVGVFLPYLGWFLGSQAELVYSAAAYGMGKQILVLSRADFIKNGVAYVATVATSAAFGSPTRIGGSLGHSPQFKIRDLIFTSDTLTPTQCLDFSAALNAKYLIY